MCTARIGLGVALLAGTALVSSGCSANKSNASNAANPSAASPDQSRPKAPSAAARASLATRPAAFDRIVAPKDAGVIIGRVFYDGKIPRPKAINFGAEKLCGDLHEGQTSYYENLVVSNEGAVKWTLVSIKGKVEGNFPTPKEPVVVDQVGCVFVPHVVAMMSGQEIEYRNSDPVSHNIRATPKKNPSFNNIFAAKMGSKSKFDAPEIGIPLKCDIHFWMSSYVHVLPHPFYAVTGEDGSFVIRNVPPGTYSLLAWHESLKNQSESVTVGAGEVKEVNFSLSSH
jgi:plastocyanin